MISQAFNRTMKSLLNPSILFILLLPFVIASVIWLTVLFMTWGIWMDWLSGTSAYQWALGALGENVFIESLKFILVLLGTLMVFGPLWYLTYIILISTLLFPMLLPRISKTYYAHLELKKGGSFTGSLWNTLIATSLFLVGIFFSMLLWLFTPLSPFANVVLTAFLNKKIFVYDVFQDFASEEERNIISLKWHREIWILGLITALLNLVPILNLLAPSITALAFIHYLLGRLDEQRAQPGSNRL